jgi:uncharacterized membrane protein YoaK (UPF0700 family)
LNLPDERLPELPDTQGIYLSINVIKHSSYFMRINRFILTSIILSYVAGFADTSTFVSADRLFSAHITGNFVILAYDIVTNHIVDSWKKLIAFPVFIVAVFISTIMIDYIDDDKKAVNRFIFLEGFLLITAGLISWFYRHENMSAIQEVLIPMLIVFAMGLQNASGRLHAKEFLAPTTVMTGGTTQFIIDLTGYLKNKDQENQNLKVKLAHAVYVILPFLIGCISGAFITKADGLGSFAFIGLLMLLLARKGSLSTAHSPILIAH